MMDRPPDTDPDRDPMSGPPSVPPPAQPRYMTIRLPTSPPVVSYSLLAVTIIVYLLQMGSSALMGGDLPAAVGVKHNASIIAGEYWRLFTPMLLHGSILHILFNMYALFNFGPTLERAYGHWRFLALYVLGGFAGNVLSFLFTEAASLGSSTAIFGLLGAEAVYLYRNRDLFGAQARRALSNLVMIAAINLMLGLQPGIDNWGHLGGLLGGSFFAWFAGPIYEVAYDAISPRLEDQHGGGEALRAGLTDFLIFAALAGMKIFL